MVRMRIARWIIEVFNFGFEGTTHGPSPKPHGISLDSDDGAGRLLGRVRKRSHRTVR